LGQVSLSVERKDDQVHTSYVLYNVGDGYLEDSGTGENLLSGNKEDSNVTLASVSSKAVNNMLSIGSGYSTEILHFPSASPRLFDFSIPLQQQLDATLAANISSTQLTVSEQP